MDVNHKVMDKTQLSTWIGNTREMLEIVLYLGQAIGLQNEGLSLITLIDLHWI